MSHVYMIGNSPMLPIEHTTEQASIDEKLSQLQVVFELLQEEHFVIITSKHPLSPFQIASIEHAILNPKNQAKVSNAQG